MKHNETDSVLCERTGFVVERANIKKCCSRALVSQPQDIYQYMRGYLVKTPGPLPAGSKIRNATQQIKVGSLPKEAFPSARTPCHPP